MKTHFIGIKGVGMTALAELVLARGDEVTGSDAPGHERFPTDTVLEALGIPAPAFDEKNIHRGLDRIIFSAAYNEANCPEIPTAKRLGIPMLPLTTALAELFNAAKTRVAVAGTNGKSTTTALLGHLLAVAKMDPSVYAGAAVPDFGSKKVPAAKNARPGRPDFFVVEADDYREQFLKYFPSLLLCHRIYHEHPDCYPTPASYAAAFRRLALQTFENGGEIVAHRQAAKMLELPARTFARNAFFADFSTRRERARPDGWNFEIREKWRSAGEFSLPLIGGHNVENALAAAAAARTLGADWDAIREGLRTFRGLRRRAEKVGEILPGAEPGNFEKIQNPVVLSASEGPSPKFQKDPSAEPQDDEKKNPVVKNSGKTGAGDFDKKIAEKIRGGAAVSSATAGVSPGGAAQKQGGAASEASVGGGTKSPSKVTIYDDYGHDPVGVRSAVEAFSRHFPGRRLVVVFHAHTFSRTREKWDEFSEAFRPADLVFLPEIYASAREPFDPEITAAGLAADICRRSWTGLDRPGIAVATGTLAETEARLRRDLRPGDLLLTLGAGNVWEIGRNLLGK